MNKNVKKILFTSLPIFVLLIVLSFTFAYVSRQKNAIFSSTTNSELLYYTLEDFECNTAINHTIENPQYQVKTEIDIHNKSNTNLGAKTIIIAFLDANNDIWEYEQKDVELNNCTLSLFVSTTREIETSRLDSVIVKFDDDSVPLYDKEEYIEIYGEDNEIVLKSAVEAYRTLTLVTIAFTIVCAVVTMALIVIYIDVSKTDNKTPKQPKRKKD